MGQDIKKLLQQDLFKQQVSAIKSNHELRFLDKLNTSLPSQINSVKPKSINTFNKKWYLLIAASVTIAIGSGVYLFSNTYNKKMQQAVGLSVYNVESKENSATSALAAISPEFEKVENYYLTSINVELTKLKVNKSNKVIVDSFMKHLLQLDNEYKELQKELEEQGASSETLEALIQNLQMRLELLQQLKEKIKNLNEYSNSNYKNLQA